MSIITRKTSIFCTIEYIPFIKGIKHIMDCENGGLTIFFIEMNYQLQTIKMIYLLCCVLSLF